MTQSSFREITASDGCRIRFRHWPAAEPRGIVIALHGIQSHSGWYKYSSRSMAEAGFDVWFADRRGSGLNGFQRGHAAHAMRLIHDVRALTQLARYEHQQNTGRTLPVTLMGISWGGRIAAAAAALFPVEFPLLALLCPGLVPRIRPTWSQTLRLNFARSFEIVKCDIPIPLRDPSLFTQSPEWRRFIGDDPLALHTVTSSLLNAGRDLDSMIESRIARICQPTLLMLAGQDSIIDNAATRNLVAHFGTERLTSLTYQDAQHTLEFESDREFIFSELIRWLDSESSRLQKMEPADIRPSELPEASEIGSGPATIRIETSGASA